MPTDTAVPLAATPFTRIRERPPGAGTSYVNDVLWPVLASSVPKRPEDRLEKIRGHWLAGPASIVIGLVLATALRYLLSRIFGVTPMYATYLPVVLIVASLFGPKAGAVTTVLSVLLAEYLFLPQTVLAIGRMSGRLSSALFLLLGVALSLVAGAMRTRTRRKELALEQLLSTEQRYFDEWRRLCEMTLKLATIVDTTDEAVIGKDVNGLVTTWNRGAEAIFGYSAAEMIGQSIRRLLPTGREGDEDEILEHIRHNETVEQFDAVRMVKGGKAIHLSLTISPIQDAGGNVVGASKIARDITEARNFQRQLEQSQKMEAIGQLAGGIAHDFNNLLTIVLGALELQQPLIAGSPEALWRWRAANQAASRGVELTQRLLAFSSVGHFVVEPIDLNASIRKAVGLASRLIGREMNMVLKLDESVPMVMADRAGLESAVLNLMVNARDAMPRGGDLTIRAQVVQLEESLAATLSGTVKPGTYACLSVTDTGMGMSPEVVERAFEPFFTTKPRERGTGLGLSMVYGFVKRSNGGAQIRSQPGHGTTVTLYLPFAAMDSQTDGLYPVPKSYGRTAGVVLIVDDEPEIVEMAVTYLKTLGYTVLSARNGVEALHIIQLHGAVDAMVTDVVMGGGMDGIELARRVRSLSPETSIVYSSGYPAEALSGRNLPLAGSPMLQKPYRLRELGAIVKSSIG